LTVELIDISLLKQVNIHNPLYLAT